MNLLKIYKQGLVRLVTYNAHIVVLLECVRNSNNYIELRSKVTTRFPLFFSKFFRHIEPLDYRINFAV